MLNVAKLPLLLLLLLLLTASTTVGLPVARLVILQPEAESSYPLHSRVSLRVSLQLGVGNGSTGGGVEDEGLALANYAAAHANSSLCFITLSSDGGGEGGSDGRSDGGGRDQAIDQECLPFRRVMGNSLNLGMGRVGAHRVTVVLRPAVAAVGGLGHDHHESSAAAVATATVSGEEVVAITAGGAVAVSTIFAEPVRFYVIDPALAIGRGRGESDSDSGSSDPPPADAAVVAAHARAVVATAPHVVAPREISREGIVEEGDGANDGTADGANDKALSVWPKRAARAVAGMHCRYEACAAVAGGWPFGPPGGGTAAWPFDYFQTEEVNDA